MTLRLTSDDARRLRDATAALLAPLAGPDPTAWWREAERRLHALFPGANAMLSRPNGARLRNESQTADAAVLHHLNAMSRVDPRTGRHGSTDPAADFWARHRRAQRIEVWNAAEGIAILDAHGFDVRRNLVYNEGLAPAGFADFAVAASEVPDGEIYLTVGDARPARRRHFDDDRAVLGLLQPALQVAHHALSAFGARRGALLATLDDMRDALLLVDADGRALHHNAALQRALAGEPARERLLATMHAMAAELRALARRGTDAGPALPARTVQTPLARYALRATFAPAVLWGQEGLVQVTLDATDAASSASDAPCEALGLTARESEVARLLARRLSNAELAAALGVSAHTARHHTERVMQKLGVRRRAEVAAMLGARPDGR
jgi:DNA-binding CsgD family transcriptional regulator/PAS domain-containing protein